MIKNITTAIKPILRLALFMSYPLLVLLALGWFLIPFSYGYIRESFAFLLLTLICIAFIVLIPKARIKQWLSVFFSLLLTVVCFIKLSFYQNYAVKLSSSALFVIFETNANEASDFLANYFNIKVTGLLVLLFGLFILIITQLKRFNFKALKSNITLKVFATVGIVCSIIVIYKRFSNENIFIKSYKSYNEYMVAKANLKANLAQKQSSNIEVTSSSEDAQTYVVVIGESASRWHMQMYGYDRETNPILSKRKKELLIFENVITTNVHTIISLDKILTLSDFDSPNSKRNASIVQLANEAGFETYWISNQKPIGLHESIPTLISNASNEQYFMSADNYSYDIHDEALLPVLDSVLAKKPKKKLVFMHLIGSHSRYKRRYPETFNYFTTNKPNAKFKSDNALELINEYDNSMRYNDFVLSEIINRVESKATNSYVLYLSDHGDEVFDTIDFVGHSEYQATNPMYEVPFLVWFSETYKQTNAEIFNVDNISKPYILEDFIHSFAEISRISFEGLNLEKSIFNLEFKPKIRYIKDGEDYDKR